MTLDRKTLEAIRDDPEILELVRKAVEDELVEWRDSGLFTIRNNGLAINYRDGSQGIIRFGFEQGFQTAIDAILVREQGND